MLKALDNLIIQLIFKRLKSILGTEEEKPSEATDPREILSDFIAYGKKPDLEKLDIKLGSFNQLKDEKIERDKEQLEVQRKDIEAEKQKLEDQQITLKSAFGEAKRKGII